MTTPASGDYDADLRARLRAGESHEDVAETLQTIAEYGSLDLIGYVLNHLSPDEGQSPVAGLTEGVEQSVRLDISTRNDADTVSATFTGNATLTDVEAVALLVAVTRNLATQTLRQVVVGDVGVLGEHGSSVGRVYVDGVEVDPDLDALDVAPDDDE